MVETAEKQSKTWKPRVQFANFSLGQEEFRVAARVVHDPKKGKIGNFLSGIFKNAQAPALLGREVPLNQAIAEARRHGRYFMDQTGKKWEVFVYQMDPFLDLSTKIQEKQTRQIDQMVETVRMEEGIHLLATTFRPKF